MIELEQEVSLDGSHPVEGAPFVTYNHFFWIKGRWVGVCVMNALGRRPGVRMRMRQLLAKATRGSRHPPAAFGRAPPHIAAMADAQESLLALRDGVDLGAPTRFGASRARRRVPRRSATPLPHRPCPEQEAHPVEGRRAVEARLGQAPEPPT